MGTTLTGSTVASTYTALLKTGDNGQITGALKTISDGNGNDSSLQLSNAAAALTGTLDVTGNVTVNTNKFIVTAASGNTTVAGTLGVAGDFAVATNKLTVAAATGNTAVAGTLSVTGNFSTSQNATCRALVQNDAAATSSFAGTVNLNGVTNFNATATFNSNVNFPAGVTVNGLTNNGTLTSPGLASIGTSGGVTLGSTTISSLIVSGPSTINGNTTLGDAAGDSVTVNAQTVRFNNLNTKTVPIGADTLLLRDSADSNNVKNVAVSSLSSAISGAIKGFSYNENSYNYIPVSPTSEQYILSGAATDWSITHTFATVGNTAYIDADVSFYADTAASFAVAIVEMTGAGTVLNSTVLPIFSGNNQSFIRVRAKFVSTASSHTFKVRFVANTSGLHRINNSTLAPFPAWFVPKSSIQIIETA